jgi:hypothetical protein
MSLTKESPVVFISCQVLQDLLERLLPADLVEQVTFMDYGLHQVPSKMKSALQETINSLEEPSLVVLGYGLCGNGLRGIKSGVHTLLMPRADDCISILLGSRQAYMSQFGNEPGTYYLSKGWLESGSHPLKEYKEYVERYGLDRAAWLMDQQYQNYQRLVLVAHSQEDMEKYRPQALEVARYCEQWGMRYEEILGSDGYVRGLIKRALEARRDGQDYPEPNEREEDFIIIPPGGEIRQNMFIAR